MLIKTHSARLWITGAASLALTAAFALTSGSPANGQSATAAATMAATMSAAGTMAATMAGPTPTAVPLSGDPVIIGVALAKTGANAAPLGADEIDGVNIAVDYYNYRGGINGRPIKISFQDTAGDAPGAINAFTTLINDNTVVGILGPVLSQQAFSSDPLAIRAGVPVIGPSNTAAGIPQMGPFVSRVSAPVAVYAPNAIKQAFKINPAIKTAVVFYAQDDAFSKSETGTFQQAVKDAGANLALVQPFLTTDRDFTSQISTALGYSPDLVVVSGLTPDAGNLIKQLRDVGYKGLIVGGNGVNTPNLLPVCQAECDGVLIAQAYNYTYPGQVNTDLRAAYKALKNGKEPGQLVAQAFTGIEVFVTALRNVDSKTKLSGMAIADLRTALNTEIQTGKYADTPIGAISFTIVKDKSGNTAGGEINQTQFAVAQVKMNADGKTGTFILLK